MLLFGCLVAFTIALAPRLMLILAWIFSPKWGLAFNTWIWPLLGIIFLPYTTIMFLLAWSPGIGIVGWDWMWILMGLLLDLWKWTSIAQNRKQVPGYPTQAQSPVSASASPAPAPGPAKSATSDELEKLAGLRDQGVITEEEFEAKKKQLLDL